MAFIDFLFGKPIPTSDERSEQIGTGAGIPVFGLDALSSAAYGPEAALTLLLPLGAAGIVYIVPITSAIIILLAIVFFSYRQTIAAYPGGGGSYTVASENLGAFAGLLAAAALMIDYVLTAAVGISAGVGALVSAVPSLLAHRLGICLAILAILTIVNLRGVREAGITFLVPTWLFLGSLLVAILMGLFKTVMASGHPQAVVAAAPAAAPIVTAAGVWLLLQAFSNGCTAMTGVEAVSNGVRAFREPRVKTAQWTLTVIIGLLMVLLAGIAYLVRAYGIVATDPSQPGYQSVLSMLLAAVTGRGIFYYVAIGSILAVLSLSANTAFADFPRLCRAIAMNGYLPHMFQSRGRRLVYSQGVYALAGLTAVLLVLFGGVTDRLIPLYAVGAFLAFTLSQAGMVAHWRRTGGKGATRSMLVNGLGALATGCTLLVVLVAKFVEGAWVTALMIPTLLGVMYAVKRHYEKVADEIRISEPITTSGRKPPLAIVPVLAWDRVARRAVELAISVAPEVRCVHVVSEDDSEAQQDDLLENWKQFVEGPAKRAGLAVPQVKVLRSPYRQVVGPIVHYILDLETQEPGRDILVVVPELVERHWYHFFLHNQRSSLLKALLLLKGNEHTIVLNVPWYIKT
ncbi:MAG: APC family permease [Candidatus Acidiferrales bacterium]|jgi:amino acid transporter